MTANTPTPELERSEDNPEQYRHWTHDELVEALILERKCSVEAAAAIAKLTAERDAAVNSGFDLMAENAILTGRAEAAERVKELSEKGMDEHIDNIILRKELNEMNAAKK